MKMVIRITLRKKESSSPPQLLSNGMLNSCLDSAIGSHPKEIWYPDVSICTSITLLYSSKLIGLHLFPNNQGYAFEGAFEALKKLSLSTNGKILDALVVGNTKSKNMFGMMSKYKDFNDSVSLFKQTFKITGKVKVAHEIGYIAAFRSKNSLDYKMYDSDFKKVKPKSAKQFTYL